MTCVWFLLSRLNSRNATHIMQIKTFKHLCFLIEPSSSFDAIYENPVSSTLMIENKIAASVLITESRAYGPLLSCCTLNTFLRGGNTVLSQHEFPFPSHYRHIFFQKNTAKNNFELYKPTDKSISVTD